MSSAALVTKQMVRDEFLEAPAAACLLYCGPRPLEKMSEGAAGYDLASDESAVIQPGGLAHLVGTGLRVALPEGTVGFIKSRSSVAFKSNVEVGAGVVDQDYRGEVKVLLRNFGDRPVPIEPGMRIAQLVILNTSPAEPNRVERRGDFETTAPSTDRGEGGFGSTGV